MDIDPDIIAAAFTEVWCFLVDGALERCTPEEAAPADLRGTIMIVDDDVVVATLSTTRSVAMAAAAAMFQLDASELFDDDAIDALGEMLNVTGGMVQSQLAIPGKLTLPTVVQGGTGSLAIRGTRVAAELGFKCEAGVIVLRILAPIGSPVLSGA